ncbi:hypothetical protein Zmor_012040 [Zophobas morio]|jgi:capping protein beta|uniref:F-actin-capping protein subunit beta n=1 Tax=Zophobas morio TaxID=2755281 RepID=A0AA38HIB7_9CUCU|nr:hypothetical protein Zmor_012040 [Zophobas morio]
MSDAQIDYALDLMRRLPPQRTQENLANLLDLVPLIGESLLSMIDQPLKIAKDEKNGRSYLLCDYNRDGDSYRSPWSNQYFPEIENGALPSSKLRDLELVANDAFEVYREMYYESGVSSVYFWDLDKGFACVVLIKKSGDGSRSIKGCWDAIHVFEIIEKGKSALYRLTSTVMLWLQTDKPASGTMNLGGSLTRQEEKDYPLSEFNMHVPNIGRMVEEMENKMRGYLSEIYFSKTKDVINDIRKMQGVRHGQAMKAMQSELAASLARRNK